MQAPALCASVYVCQNFSNQHRISHHAQSCRHKSKQRWSSPTGFRGSGRSSPPTRTLRDTLPVRRRTPPRPDQMEAALLQLLPAKTRQRQPAQHLLQPTKMTSLPLPLLLTTTTISRSQSPSQSPSPTNRRPTRRAPSSAAYGAWWRPIPTSPLRRRRVVLRAGPRRLQQPSRLQQQQEEEERSSACTATR